MERIVIRNMEEKDIEGVAEVHVSSWKTAYRGIVQDRYLDAMKKEEKIVSYKKKQMDVREKFLVAEQNGEIVGFCRYADDNRFSENMSDIDCEIVALYVSPDKMYHGIGTKLFQAAVETFICQKKHKMIIWCLRENKSSKRFYEKMGGKMQREKKVCIGDKSYCEDGFVYDIRG
ncbi:GNAT family N-acetyltransferase [Sellimonas caecigallum]|uniref:GNAT family N-acetyltransferase n=1 Tax=Sellimonas caecigallum TaxID=2592333 RepID=A0ABS7L427_9FIRM|nr:GNAT family N-acetyltransferase [Sellimonas caecigallum]MBY0757781.1 GNAT family N-acetyltransferase [Sellimonas caecigallum]